MIKPCYICFVFDTVLWKGIYVHSIWAVTFIAVFIAKIEEQINKTDSGGVSLSSLIFFLTVEPFKQQFKRRNFFLCGENLYVYHQSALFAQSYATLCNSMDCSPPGSSVHGIFQARILEWVAISFSRGSSWSRDQTRVFRITGRLFTIWV